MDELYRIHPEDNVAVAIRPLKAGEACSAGELRLTAGQDIPFGHKAALRGIAPGGIIVKYGFPIGRAKTEIRAGDWVHTHNMETRLSGLLEYTYRPSFHAVSPLKPETFSGYRRGDGKVGIRNEVWIVPTVGCVNAVARMVEEESRRFLTPEIDGICAFSHPYGCSQLSQDLRNTQLALCGLIRHPNAGGVLVLGLGCENNGVEELKKVLGPYDPDRVKFLVCQEHENEVADAAELVGELCRYASRAKREPCSASELTVGLKCGGSDAFSGITANPLAGAFADRLISEGGTAVMTEVPEMFGAETLLMDRCRDEETFRRTVELINNFKQYFERYGEKIDGNPSPGNHEGGITTLEEKSLGCVQKGGTSPVTDVLSYGSPVREKGLSLLQGPGNDLVSTAALAVSGAQLVLFTTGRGTPFGCPVPTLKISSNSALAARKPDWIDFDAGRLLTGESMASVSGELFRLVLETASGTRHVKSERFGKNEFSIFKDGVTL